MKVLQYNIWDGCREPERFDAFDRWMRERRYDVIGFNELKGWSGEELSRLAAEWGCPHSAIHETQASKHYIGVISRHPIRVVDKVEKPFHHGLLHVIAGGVHFCLTHLSPRSSVAREAEARALAERTGRVREPLLLMGDLNTLSPLDRDIYARTKLLDVVKRNDKLFAKFAANDELNYEPMNVLLNSGLADIGCAETFRHSVPTRVNLDKMHAAPMRIDYMLANRPLLDLKPTAVILQDGELDYLSDHYPIECRWPSTSNE